MSKCVVVVVVVVAAAAVVEADVLACRPACLPAWPAVVAGQKFFFCFFRLVRRLDPLEVEKSSKAQPDQRGRARACVVNCLSRQKRHTIMA